jgi:hypothetical protein
VLGFVDTQVGWGNRRLWWKITGVIWVILADYASNSVTRGEYSEEYWVVILGITGADEEVIRGEIFDRAERVRYSHLGIILVKNYHRLE